MSGTILVGENSTVEHVPPHPILDEMTRALRKLTLEHRTTPQQIVDALACIATITDRMGPPMTIVKNPYEG